jgi:hypothetical protein
LVIAGTNSRGLFHRKLYASINLSEWILFGDIGYKSLIMSFLPFTLMLGLLMCPAFKGNWIIIEHGPTLRLIQGIVEFEDGSPAEGIVMELHDQPDVILISGPEWQRKQKLIGSVTTDHNGRFRFPKVPSGRY